MKQLDREGVFKALPVSWGVQTSEQSQAVALVVEFQIVAQDDPDGWIDWSPYEPHSIFGYFYITKRDGTINTATVENLAKVLGWNGDIAAITNGPPSVVCQITVASEDYNGKSSLRVKWLNPEDYQPGPALADGAKVKALDAQLSPRLRAVCAAVLAKAPAAAAPAAPKPAPTRRGKPAPDATATAAGEEPPF